ncbi:hypothetical protein JHK82_018409 [Glycine max]|nr:hypothetical protein JHK82_018409 [Glycine max]KHN40330.1 tRNA-splicing endonuclease subunit Sen54 [Glycine soja]
MEGKTRGCSSSEDSDGEIYLQNASDEEELGSSSGSMPKLQFRNVKSKGCWNEEMGMGEVIEKNGKMWITTGIVRSGKIYSSIEETLYLMELGALDIVDNDGRSLSLTEMYEKVASGKSGCCWELFEVYRHLKSLGYIIGRHGVAWSLKSIKSSHKAAAVEVTEESKQLEDTDSKSELSINKLWVLLTSALRTLVKKLKGESLESLLPVIQVFYCTYLGGRQCGYVISQSRILRIDKGVVPVCSLIGFKGDSHLGLGGIVLIPGGASVNEQLVVLYHVSPVRVQNPPSRAEIEALEKQCGGIPLKICLVTEGRVSFFSFDKVELPVIP